LASLFFFFRNFSFFLFPDKGSTFVGVYVVRRILVEGSTCLNVDVHKRLKALRMTFKLGSTCLNVKPEKGFKYVFFDFLLLFEKLVFLKRREYKGY